MIVAWNARAVKHDVELICSPEQVVRAGCLAILIASRQL
jgi:hypothetical protein